MFGHLDAEEGYVPWARHLAALKDLNRGWTPESGRGRITEFVPLPFVPMEAPAFRRGDARRGPTFRESILVHAVGRLALFPEITHVQASWTKLGPAGARVALCAGADDMGGTLMNESISRAAGAGHGQEMNPERMDALAKSLPPDPPSASAAANDVNAAPRDTEGGMHAAHYSTGPIPRAVQRTTLYDAPDPIRVARSMHARGNLIA
jgi:FO synthase